MIYMLQFNSILALNSILQGGQFQLYPWSLRSSLKYTDSHTIGETKAGNRGFRALKTPRGNTLL